MIIHLSSKYLLNFLRKIIQLTSIFKWLKQWRNQFGGGVVLGFSEIEENFHRGWCFKFPPGYAPGIKSTLFNNIIHQ